MRIIFDRSERGGGWGDLLKKIQAIVEWFLGLTGGLGEWFWPGTYPPQPSVGARWRLGKEKGVTDFSVTPWHSSWWSWRESNPRPLECHANSPLKLFAFFKNLASSHRAFVGSCQQSPVGLWRISQRTANRLPTVMLAHLWLACQRVANIFLAGPPLTLITEHKSL